MIYEQSIETILLSCNKEKLDVNYIHHYLANESYWAKNIPLHVVQKSIEGSLCFGIYEKKKQIGFARVITDYATFGYLADVFIDKGYRGKGLSKILMQFIMNHPDVKTLRRFMLATLDAHGLYEQFGFMKLEGDKRLMGIKFFEQY
jgi:N-acetylglutamate synthase-like GNAT family acetyltransferase